MTGDEEQVDLSFNYGSAVAVFPAAAAEYCGNASAEELRVLLLLASDASLASDEERLAEKAGIGPAELEKALERWISSGILSPSAPGAASAAPKKKARATAALSDALPKYSTDELGTLLENRSEYRELIDGCQSVFKKIFNTTEISIIVGMTEYLGLTPDCILLLFAHCGKLEHRSVRTVEKLAIKLHDEGVTEADALAERLCAMEETAKAETNIRKIFGISSRAFTAKEKKLVAKWVSEYKYDFEMISRAYDLTVDSTQKPSIPYAAAIIDRWHAEGIKTVDDIERDIEEHRKKTSSADDASSSFDTDDFFAAAIKRGKEKTMGGA